MVAAYIGMLEGVSSENIKRALADLVLTKNRVEWLKASNGADILSDVYNANPTAMRLILETFQTIDRNPDGKKIAVLADMKELGEQSPQLHRQMITALDPQKLDLLYLYGEEIEPLAAAAMTVFEPDAVKYFRKDNEKDALDALLKDLLNTLSSQDQLLLKGSNSMKLSTLIDGLC